MEKVKLYYDREGNTLNVWFDDPKKEHICEEVADDVILAPLAQGTMKRCDNLANFPDNNGQVIPSRC